MNKKISLGAAIAFMFIVAAAAFSATWNFAELRFNQKSTALEQSREMYAKFTEVDRTVRANYGGQINEVALMDSVAQGYIKGIGDKYAMYISAEEFKNLTQSKAGEDIGIGAVLETSPEGYLSVVEVYPDSPAQVAGIVAGDLIVKINDVNLTTENVDQYKNTVQGEAGTKISLVVRKDREDVVIPELTRRVVTVPSVYSRVIPDTGVGYIMIKQFNDNTSDQFTRELHKIIEAGANSLIFDVRDNKGPSMSAAVRILDKLVPEGVIYSATYWNGTTEEMAYSDANEITLPMVVLANSATSGAAELFAQDLKDFGKASIVGNTTTGKGIIQTRKNLTDGSAIDLTIGVINPRSGVTFDGTGVKPDYDIPAADGDFTKMSETSDPQLKKALEVAMAMRKVEVTVQAEAEAAASQAAESSSSSSSAPESSAPESSASESESSDASSSEGESEDESESSGEDEPSDDESSGESSPSSSEDDNSPLDKDPSESDADSSASSESSGESSR